MHRTEHLAADPRELGIDPEKLEALFARVRREVDAGLLPSAQVAIARHGRLAGMRTFGSVTHEGRPAAATDETLYSVFSATKAIVSSAAWLLVEEGRLDLDAPVASLVPEFGTNGKDRVRVEQLFTHTCGFPYAPYPPSEWPDREKRLERFSRWRLTFEPGTRFEYHATASMWVVAELIERIAGVDFRRFIRERIAEPLGLEDLHVGLPRPLQARLADIEHRNEEATAEDWAAAGLPEIPVGEVDEKAIQSFNQAPVRAAGAPGGGGAMTAAELALFYQALLAAERGEGPPGLWKPETIRSVRRVRSGDLLDPFTGQRANRALGLIVAGGPERVTLGFGHSGSAEMYGHNGAGGQIAFADPTTGLSVGYCTNGFDRHRLRVARRTVGIASRAAECVSEPVV